MKALCLLLLLGFALPAVAQPGPLVVILLPGTSLRDWQSADAPNLHRLIATGALAVMNTRTARLPNDRARETPESAALTLGAGARAAGGPEDAVFYGSGDAIRPVGVSAGALYERRCGYAVPPQLAVNLGWPSLLRENAGRGYDIHLGNLADTLTVAGIPIRAGGRFSNMPAVSGDGTVRTAAVFAVQPSECLIWDSGSDLPAADALLGEAAAQIAAQRGHLMVLSPFANDADYAQGRRLTPVLEWGHDIPAGLIVSTSTRRPGLVTNTDFAPTVAAYFGQTAMATRPFGQVWSTLPTAHAAQKAQDLEEEAYRQAQGMKILPYLAVGLTLWVLIGTGLTLTGKMPLVWPLVPATFLLAMLWSSAAAMTPFLCLAFLLSAWAFSRRFPARTLLTAILSAFVLTLMVDMVTGSRLMQRSLLGYSAVEGARYYGIGNEAMGALIGSLLVIAANLWTQARLTRIALTLLLAVVALLLGSSLAGAKAGGLLVSAAAFGTLLYALWGGRWSWRVALAGLLVAALVMAASALGEALLPGSRHSHIGEAAARIQMGGWGEAQDIIGRKLAVESRLAYHSAWACLLWSSLLCFMALGKRIGERAEQRSLQTAGLVAIIACLALNDAGVVAAALCLVPLWSDTAANLLKEKPLKKIASPGAMSALN